MAEDVKTARKPTRFACSIPHRARWRFSSMAAVLSVYCGTPMMQLPQSNHTEMASSTPPNLDNFRTAKSCQNLINQFTQLLIFSTWRLLGGAAAETRPCTL